MGNIYTACQSQATYTLCQEHAIYRACALRKKGEIIDRAVIAQDEAKTNDIKNRGFADNNEFLAHMNKLVIYADANECYLDNRSKDIQDVTARVMFKVSLAESLIYENGAKFVQISFDC